MKSGHSIREERLEVEVDSETLALALQPRLADVNRQHFLPLIERVFDELDVPGRRIRIGTLRVDLGWIPFASFTEVAAERLYHELRRVLEEHLRGLNEGPTAEGVSLSDETAWLELLEHYLLTGTLPFWATRAATFSLQDLMSELAEDDPEGLAAAVRRHGRKAQVRERLLMQLSEEALQRLLHLLEPEHAALIIDYMIDLRGIHRVKPVLRGSDGQVAHAIWLLVLAYITHDPGSHFNRRSFLKSLLEGIAESAGLGYPELLQMLCASLHEVERQHTFRHSLPTALRELEREIGPGAQASPTRPTARETPEEMKAPLTTGDTVQAASELTSDETRREPTGSALAALAHYLGTGQLPAAEGEERQTRLALLRDLLRRLAAHDASSARQVIWNVARRREPGLSLLTFRLLRAFTPAELLAVLAPRARASVESFVGALSMAHAGAGATTDASKIEGPVWESLLEYLLREPTSRLDVRGMVRQVVEAVAWRGGVRAVTLAEALGAALNEAAEVGDELSQMRQEVSEYVRGMARQAGEARPVFTRYDQAEILRYYFQYGLLPWGALARDPSLTPQDALACLPFLTRSLLRSVFHVESPEGRMATLLRAARLLPEEGLATLLRRLFHQARGTESPFWRALAEAAENSEDKQAFYARLIAANLDGLRIDLEQLAAAPRSAQTAGESPSHPGAAGWDAHTIKSALAHGLRFGVTRAAGMPALDELLHILLTKHPREARHFLAAVRDTPDMPAALARRSPAPLFGSLLELLAPHGAEILRALLRALDGIPAPYRPGNEEFAREVILYELLRLEEGEPLGETFFARVLRKLFGATPHAQATRTLLQESAGWSASGKVPQAQAAALEAAVKFYEARGGGAAALAGPGREDAGQTPTAPLTPAQREAVFAFLRGEGPATDVGGESQAEEEAAPRQETLSDDALAHALLLMLERLPEAVGELLHRHPSRPRDHERWVKVLPESALVRLSYLIEPQKHRALLDAAEVLASAWLEAVPPAAQALADRESYWRFIFEFLKRNAEADRTVGRLVAAFFEYAAARYQASWPGGAAHSSVAERLLENARRLADEAGQSGVRSILHRDRAHLLSLWNPNATPARVPSTGASSAEERPGEAEARNERSRRRGPARASFSLEDDVKDDAATDRTVYINNAGLVLTGPFLPHLFRSLDLLTADEGGRARLRDANAVSRAVHLLQYLVDGSTDTPEPALVLNKVMCGVPTATPVEREIEPTEQEREICERLLKAIIANWKIIENTSVAGLQQTFLRREGRLDGSADGWKLKVQRKTLDVLVDQIPWSISVVFNQWMPQPLHVTW